MKNSTGTIKAIQKKTDYLEWSVVDCNLCNHPLIEHGYASDDVCGCCSGAMWDPSKNPSKVDLVRSKKEKGRTDTRNARGFVVIADFPEYVINHYGTVKHIEKDQFPLYIRLSSTGSPLILLRRDGKSHVKDVAVLHRKAFGSEQK